LAAEVAEALDRPVQQVSNILAYHYQELGAKDFLTRFRDKKGRLHWRGVYARSKIEVPEVVASNFEPESP
jgi:hypothetical protein